MEKIANLKSKTVVIDVVARYKNKASVIVGVKNTTREIERMNSQIDKIKGKADKAISSLDKIAKVLDNIGKISMGMCISIPVKIIDYATKPLKSISSFASKIGKVVANALSGIGVMTNRFDILTTKISTNPANLAPNSGANITPSVTTKSGGILNSGIFKEINEIGNANAGNGKAGSVEGLAGIKSLLSLIKKKETSGAIMGALGVVSAYGDFKSAADTANEKEKDVNTKSGVIKGGSVATGAGIGALIGSFLPGGALVGAGIGAGIGGITAISKGEDWGEAWSDFDDGKAKIKDIGEALTDSSEKYQQFFDKSAKTDELVQKYHDLKKKIDDSTLSSDDAKKAQQEYNDVVAELKGMYPGLISEYDKENGKLEDKLELMKNIADTQKNQSKIQLQQDIIDFEDNLPKLKDKVKEYQDRIYASEEKASQYQDKHIEAKALEKSGEKAIKEYESKHGEGSTLSLRRFQKEDGSYTWGRWDYDKQQHIEDEDTKAYTKEAELAIEFIVKNGKDFDIDEIASSKNLESFLTQDFGENYRVEGQNQVDSYNADSAELNEFRAEGQKGYDAQVQMAKLESGIDVDKYTKMIEEIRIYKEEIDKLKNSLNKEENPISKKEIQKDIDKKKAEQQELVSEVDKVKVPLQEVYAKIGEIGTQLGALVTQKYEIEVGVKYVGLPPTTIKEGVYPPPEKHSGPLEMYATGTPSATKGIHWVGEKGPELVNFGGGERVYNAGQSQRIAKMNATAIENSNRQGTAQQTTISLGGINVEVNGASDTVGIMSAIRSQMPEIADNLCRVLSKQLTQIYGNMPLNVKGV